LRSGITFGALRTSQANRALLAGCTCITLGAGSAISSGGTVQTIASSHALWTLRTCRTGNPLRTLKAGKTISASGALRSRRTCWTGRTRQTDGPLRTCRACRALRAGNTSRDTAMMAMPAVVLVLVCVRRLDCHTCDQWNGQQPGAESYRMFHGNYPPQTGTASSYRTTPLFNLFMGLKP